MTDQQIILQKKAEALNKIRKIFNPKTQNHYLQSWGDDHESYAEQREYWVRNIIETLEKDLNTFKQKQKRKDANGNTK